MFPITSGRASADERGEVGLPSRVARMGTHTLPSDRASGTACTAWSDSMNRGASHTSSTAPGHTAGTAKGAAAVEDQPLLVAKLLDLYLSKRGRAAHARS